VGSKGTASTAFDAKEIQFALAIANSGPRPITRCAGLVRTKANDEQKPASVPKRQNCYSELNREKKIPLIIERPA
jgi:hypothetical protein